MRRVHLDSYGSTAAFTLIELLVVIAILGALSVVALRATSGLKDRAAFETTQRTLEEVRTAILGAPGSLPGDPARAGFLNDMGRLPNSLDELWQPPVGVQTSHVASTAADTDVQLATGWRGPYLQLPILPIGAALPTLLDGHRFPFVATIDATHWIATSLGADELVGGAGPYDADVQLVLLDTSVTPPVDPAGAELNGTVNVLSIPTGTWRVSVWAYAPDPTTGGLNDIEATSPATDITAAPASVSYTFAGANGLSAGTRIVRAYLYDAAAPSDHRPTGTPRSRVQVIPLAHGAQTVELRIDG